MPKAKANNGAAAPQPARAKAPVPVETPVLPEVPTGPLSEDQLAASLMQQADDDPVSPAAPQEPVPAPEESGEPAAGDEPVEGAEPATPESDAAAENPPVEEPPAAEGDEPAEAVAEEVDPALADIPDLTPGQQTKFGGVLAKERQKLTEKFTTEKVAPLEAKIAELTTQLESARAVVPTDDSPDPIEKLATVADLAKAEQDAKTRQQGVAKCLELLNFNPDRVAGALKAAGIELKDEDGNEDYSKERMYDALSEMRDNNSRVLEAAPKKRQLLELQGQAQSRLAKGFPWLAKADDPKTAEVQGILQQFPALRRHPAGLAFALAIQQGVPLVQAVMDKVNGKVNGNGVGPVKPAVAPPKPAPVARRSSAAPVVKPGAASTAADKRFMESPSEKNLAEKLAA